MKTKSKIIIIIMIVVMTIVYTIFYFCTAVKMNVDKITYTEYPTIEITEKEKDVYSTKG